MLLLDTCTLLWVAADQSKLSETARSCIGDHAGQLWVSAISAFEIGTRHRKGHLELPVPPADWYGRALANHGVRECPVTGAIAATSTTLPTIHLDPADRIIIATAQFNDLTIVTPDSHIAAYPNTRVVW